MGYFGGKFDLFFQRLIEIWSSLPMLFVIIILSSILKPSFLLLIGIYTLVNWISMTYLMRAEFYREKSRAYVAAALSMGQSNFKIMFKHILANSLVPIITYFPFSVVLADFYMLDLLFDFPSRESFLHTRTHPRHIELSLNSTPHPRRTWVTSVCVCVIDAKFSQK